LNKTSFTPGNSSARQAIEPTSGQPFRCGFVAVVGRPNAGKSTLVNALVGEKVSIVAPVPQTTRNRILGFANRPGAQVIFMDTPGTHKPHTRLDQQMMQFVHEALAKRDLALFIVDASANAGKGDEFVIELLREHRARAILALNKIDGIRKPRLLPLIERFSKLYDFEEIFPISALHGEGLEILYAALAQRLPEGEALFPPDQYTDQPERFLAGELIREKVILNTRQELPHVTAVQVEDWQESEQLTRICALILVEKQSQKPIVIGAEGSRIRQIGMEARADLERIFPPKVFLELHVQVAPGWRNDRETLATLEYRY
jgi:GTPase